MRSLFDGQRAIRELLARRGLDVSTTDERRRSRRLLARWGRRGLSQLTRRYRAARAAAPGDLLERKWDALDVP